MSLKDKLAEIDSAIDQFYSSGLISPCMRMLREYRAHVEECVRNQYAPPPHSDDQVPQ